MSTRPLLHESLRNLCRQAMGEQDLGELLKIFLELDTAVQRERGHSYLADPPQTSDTRFVAPETRCDLVCRQAFG